MVKKKNFDSMDEYEHTILIQNIYESFLKMIQHK